MVYKKKVGWNLSLCSKTVQWMDALTQGTDTELTLGSAVYHLICFVYSLTTLSIKMFLYYE